MNDPLNTPERDWSAPTRSEHKQRTCRGCGAVLVHGDRFNIFNGWAWCTEPCYREIVALYMNEPSDLRELEGQERASRADIDRDDFNLARR